MSDVQPWEPLPALETAIANGSGHTLLAQPMRRLMMDIIRREPGIKISQLCRETTAGWGTIKYHLHLLRRAGLIVARNTGRDCLLFASDVSPEDVAAKEALRRGRAGHLARAIADTPGASQKELCERIHMTRKIIRRYVELLEHAGLVNERREAQFQRYYPGPALGRHLLAGENGAATPAAEKPPVDPMIQ